MNKAYREIESYISVNALHRRGFRLGDMPAIDHVCHARDEIDELIDAAESTQKEELADVFGCLLAFCVKKGWTLEEVEIELLRKLPLRLTK